MKTFYAGSKLTLLHGEDRFFGPGPYSLLEAMSRLGSVKEACRKMDISYSKAWKIIEKMERSLGFTVVERYSGGKKGGSAQLTENGVRLLEAYRKMEEEVSPIIQKHFEKHFSWLEKIEDKHP